MSLCKFVFSSSANINRVPILCQADARHCGNCGEQGQMFALLVSRICSPEGDSTTPPSPISYVQKAPSLP